MLQWLHLRKYCVEFKETERDVRQRLADGVWSEGVHAQVRDGELFIYIREAKAWLAQQRRLAHVYLIAEADSERPIKIGVAANVQHRLGNLQIGNHRLLVVRAAYAFRSWNMAYKAEREAHQNFRHCGVRGEWFDATAEEIGTWLTRTFGRYLK